MISALDQASSDARWMQEALREAARAAQREEVPIGCVIVRNDEVLAQCGNQLEQLQQPTAHAELLAIEAAAEKLGSRRLLDCTMYVTLEPCPMCAGAIVNARIPRLVYAASDPKAGAVHTLYSLCSDERLNHRCEIISGIGAEESAELLKSFFARIRQQKKGSGDGV